MSFEEKLILKKRIKGNLERLKTELTCQVCFRLFRDPQTLSCSHSYCKVCIKQLLQTSKDKGKFSCPQCRRLTSRREASHADQMLAALVAKLREFWKIMPREMDCDALTQNTQYYANYTVPKHMRASQILSRHRQKSIDAPSDHNNNNNTNASDPDSDSNSSQHTQRSHLSHLSNLSTTSNIENEPNSTTTRRVTFNSNPDIETYDKDEYTPVSPDTNHNRPNAEEAAREMEPLYTEEELHFLSQNRPKSPVTEHTHDAMDIDEEEKAVIEHEEENTTKHASKEDTSSIASDDDLSEPMFSLDPDAHHMAGYTLDFGLDSMVEHAEDEQPQMQHVQKMEMSDENDEPQENTERIEEDKASTDTNQPEAMIHDQMDDAVHNDPMDTTHDMDTTTNDDANHMNDDTTTTDTNEAEPMIKPKATPMVSVSTRSRRKNKKYKSATSHLLQSKSYMASQSSQIVLDIYEPNEDENGLKSDKADVSYVADAIHEEEDDDQDIDILNIHISDPMDLHRTEDTHSHPASTTSADINIKPSEPKRAVTKKVRRKSVGKRKKKSKKQKDQSKLEAVGLQRSDFVEGDHCAVCCEDVDDIGVYCDGCDVFVHMQCYGITRKPTRKEEWFCDPCTRDLNLMRDCGQHMECAICGTNTDRAYKAVKKKNTWAHTSCALWITGCNFVNKQTLSPISLDAIDPDRYKLRCIFCKKRGGACLQCELCTNSFHVPCGLRGTAMLELRDADGDRCYFHSFCPLHTDDASRNSVPDNNHDFHGGSKRGRKRKRDATDDEDEEEDTTSRRSKSATKRNKTQSKRRKLRPKSKSERTSKSKGKEDGDMRSRYPLKAPLLRSPDVRKRKLEHSAPVILCSKLTMEQIDDYEAFKEKFGNVVTFTAQWKPNVTHLVTSATCAMDGRILEARTIKYFQSVIAGCWVMCFDWIEACLLRNTLMEESTYEVLGDKIGRGAAKKSRELRNKNDDGLFANVIAVVASEFRFAKLDEDLRCIFRIGGAKVLKMLPYTWLKNMDKHKKEMKGKNVVFVYDKGDYDMTQKQLDFCNKFGVLPIGYQQMFDTISNYKPISHRMLSAE